MRPPPPPTPLPSSAELLKAARHSTPQPTESDGPSVNGAQPFTVNDWWRSAVGCPRLVVGPGILAGGCRRLGVDHRRLAGDCRRWAVGWPNGRGLRVNIRFA